MIRYVAIIAKTKDILGEISRCGSKFCKIWYLIIILNSFGYSWEYLLRLIMFCLRVDSLWKVLWWIIDRFNFPDRKIWTYTRIRIKSRGWW